MPRTLLTITEYCGHYHVKPEFIAMLEEMGIMEFTISEHEKYVREEQLKDLERYRLLHYELHINPEGIDAIRHLLVKQTELYQEIATLKSLLRLHE